MERHQNAKPGPAIPARIRDLDSDFPNLDQSVLLDWSQTALGDESQDSDLGGDLDRHVRQSFQRPDFDDQDISEVEYRRVQLERAYLVGIFEQDRHLAQVSLTELAALADTAGAEVVGASLQRKAQADPATYIGRGKAQEIAAEIKALQADTLIVNAALLPSQRRGLEDVVKVKVIDRTAVILDIFAQHAQSKEGKAQVELAQLEYLLPRLRGWGHSLSRQAGGRVAAGAGIGSRGPGETKIELDRRRIKTRMAKLRTEIKQMKKARDTKRSSRKKTNTASVVIAGYTNAGKSSLLNALVGSDVMVQNALFATLDPTVRKTRTAAGRQYTLTDTVGFITDLPLELVEAFRSTLEEVSDADVVVHVVDASHHDPQGQIQSVQEIFQDLTDLSQVPQLIVFNKIDLVDPIRLRSLESQFPHCYAVSAHSGQGLAELKAGIEAALPAPGRRIDYLIPYQHSALVDRLHQEGQVEQVQYLPEGTRVIGRANPRLAQAILEVSLG